ncbi:GET complex subunit get1 [Ascosphaera acerosa]|nr:GET complex subunit get1 [Ascosphaera acerosa]
MASLALLLGVLALHIVIYAVSAIGTAALNALVSALSPTGMATAPQDTNPPSQAWSLVVKLPTKTGDTARRRAALKTEVVQLKQQMTATSAQDEFAKWAKLRRKHDKALEQYEQCNKTLVASKVRFNLILGSVRWAATSGLKIGVLFWNSKTPAFALPPRWLPYSVEWVLSFPRAPVGTVSIQVWSAACATVVKLVGGAVTGSWGPAAPPAPGDAATAEVVVEEAEAEKKVQ